MPQGYHHLDRDQRCQLDALKKRGDSLPAIAQALGVHPSSVCRELRRNKGRQGYRHKQANENAQRRRIKACRAKKKMTPEMVAIIEEKLRLQWSPVQISGWLKKNGYAKAVSHETIYRHIWQDKRSGGSLYKELRHHGKKYNKRSKGTAGRGCIPNRIDIKERPPIVEKKSRLGDWELDTIIGAGQSGAIVSMVERASKLTKLARVSRKTAEETETALIEKLNPVREFVRTLTADNGKEFANHQKVGCALGADFYFATPYHSWERGLNEHTNGLVRQYFPKSKRFDQVSDDVLEKVEMLLNNRPRKILNFSTPQEVFTQMSERAVAPRLFESSS
jgi:IS30 family transposase